MFAVITNTKFLMLVLNFHFSLLPLIQVEQIQAEYKVLALQHHPDKNPDDAESEARFQELQVRTIIFSSLWNDMFNFTAGEKRRGHP